MIICQLATQKGQGDWLHCSAGPGFEGSLPALGTVSTGWGREEGLRMGKQKGEKEKRGERRTRMGPGAWLLGTTARHSEMKPDAEESGRKRGAGVQVVHPGLGVSVAQAARTPGGPGVCGASWWGCLSGCSDPNPPGGRHSGWKPGWGGLGLPYL